MSSHIAYFRVRIRVNRVRVSVLVRGMLVIIGHWFIE